MKSDKIPCMIYADLESSRKSSSKNSPEKSSATTIGEHIPCGYSVAAIWAFDSTKNKHSLYCGEYYMKRFFISLREFN